MNLLKTTIGKCFLFGVLYFPEGLMGALSTVIVPLYLASLGFSASVVGLVVGLTSIPWVIKIIWGTMVDYYSSKGRKFFVIAGGTLGAVMCFLLFLSSPNFLILFSFVLFLARCGIAILDVSTDAFSIENTVFEERGKVNGAMFFGQLSGFAFGSLVLTKISVISFSLTFLSVGILTLFLISTVVFAKERKIIHRRISFAELKDAFFKKLTLLIALFAILVDIPFGLISGMATYYMKVYLSISATLIGTISLLNGISNAFGAYGFGYLSDKYGRFKGILFAIIPATILAFSLSFLKSFPVFYIIYGIFVGGITAVMCALFMDITFKDIAATEYAILTSLANFGIFIGTTLSGFLLQNTSPRFFFMISAMLYIPPILILRRLYTIKH